MYTCDSFKDVIPLKCKIKSLVSVLVYLADSSKTREINFDGSAAAI